MHEWSQYYCGIGLFLWCLYFQSYCNDPDLVLELKNLIVIFADTLQVSPERDFEQLMTLKCVEQLRFIICVYVQDYGFPVNRLFDLLFEVRDQYNETLLKKWALVFRWAFMK